MGKHDTDHSRLFCVWDSALWPPGETPKYIICNAFEITCNSPIVIPSPNGMYTCVQTSATTWESDNGRYWYAVIRIDVGIVQVTLHGEYGEEGGSFTTSTMPADKIDGDFPFGTIPFAEGYVTLGSFPPATVITSFGTQRESLALDKATTLVEPMGGSDTRSTTRYANLVDGTCVYVKSP